MFFYFFYFFFNFFYFNFLLFFIIFFYFFLLFLIFFKTFLKLFFFFYFFYFFDFLPHIIPHIYHKFYHKPLPVLPSTPPQRCLYLRETQANVLRGLQRFWGGCKDLYLRETQANVCWLLVFSMPAEIFKFFISELRAKVQYGCKDLATISERRHCTPEGHSLWGTMLSYPILKDYQHWKSHYSLFLPFGVTI